MEENFRKRFAKNCTAFIIVYAFVGIMSGLIFDVLATYLMAVSPGAARSISSYMGFATFVSAFFAILVPKIGYRRIIAFASVVTTASFILVSYIQNQWVIGSAVFLVMVGTALFDVILPPFIAAYTEVENRTSMFTRTAFANVFGTIAGTFLGGPMIVWLLSGKLGIGYDSARLLTKNIAGMNPEQYLCYIDSHRMVLMAFALFSILMLIPALQVKEMPQDYIAEEADRANGKTNISGFLNKYVVVFLIYGVIGRFAAGIIAPQVSMYLTKIGINRASVSMIMTLEYVAILICMLFSSKIVGKIGKVNTISLLYLSSVPFMLILANGYRYGSSVEIIVGTALFFRTGLVNAANPAMNALSMELVSKNYRSLYASLACVVQSLAQIGAGMFGSAFLFGRDRGYADAYYFASILYIAAHVMLLLVFSKRYNKFGKPFEKAADIN
jgi:Arabinose efflux permease